ncbi:hypothetical protein PILCRDRAFT_3459 [Piloderma croceum F 1598]|uniref:TRIP4/RQT4 C2HC5-type zinc finger domain-containing protein n=1 Tax=Piloderma croceum (strain F 1598) TaxID=765440 RepID=A0A0C3GCV9_PILCF|nr:hypothetical protein PILCRDRAFT_3459 [Piloderma croceum F 1598]
MHQTPWTKKASSFPSERIKSNSPSSSSANNKGKGKARDPPKSKEVRKLEALADGVRGSSGKETDPKGGCFCQARNHDLSTYTALCRDCGLILCELNMPYWACPHCISQILTPSVRTSLLARLETQILERLALEERDRERAMEDARRAAGAFPTLTAGAAFPSSEGNSVVGQGAVTSGSINEAVHKNTHKVLSLNAKTKKATLSSYTTSPVPSRPPSRPISTHEDEEPEPVRVHKPPTVVAFVGKLDHIRPWADLKSVGDGVKYIPAGVLKQAENLGPGEPTAEKRRRTRRHRAAAGDRKE